MDLLRENWFWILVAIAFFAMHIFGHGAHGGGGGHGSRDDEPPQRDRGQHDH